MGMQWLPKDCISSILSPTSPGDACRLSTVASHFRSAADSDAVWEKFPPSDYKDLISRTVDFSSSSLKFASKKERYLRLCDSPLVIDDGRLSFWLEKQTGKKCYMIAARAIHIAWSDELQDWIPLPESRFPEVEVLLGVTWLEIRGCIKSSFLTPNTTYAAYLVFKLEDNHYGFMLDFADVSVGTNASTSQTRSAFLTCETRDKQSAWASVPIEEINKLSVQTKEVMDGDDGDLETSVLETRGFWKRGLIVQGIEIRPQNGN
ncbi:Phloem protein 2-like [Dillenia turbinata]|uniref:Phloem protein 2-like n=1 Tax=Dillenia turbinata TaxID=194707 RepID=A0AAN8UUN1_9MAGN